MPVLDRTTYINVKDIAASKETSTSPPRQTPRNTLCILCFIAFIAVFDFTIYIFFVDYIKQAFLIVSKNVVTAYLQFFSLFAVGFLTQPIGAFFIGQYGNNKGRKPALQICLLILFITTLITACLPTYAHIGIIAPILLLVVILCNGAAFGGQLGLNWVYIAESLPRKHLAVYISLLCAAMVLGSMTSAIIVAVLNHVLTDNQLVTYGWRIACTISALFILAALILSQKLDETPLFLASKAQDGTLQSQASSHVAVNRFNAVNAVIVTALLSLVASNLAIIIALILPELIALRFSINPDLLRLANIGGLALLAFGMVFYGWLATRIGMGRALMIGSAILAVQAFVFFYYLSHSGGHYIVPLYALLGFCSGIYSICILIIIKLFPIKSRLGAIGTIFNMVAAFSGTLLPILLLYITNIISFSPALYIMIIAICAFIIGLHVAYSPNISELEFIDYEEYENG